MTFQDEVTRLVVSSLPNVAPGKGTLAQRVHAYLWPFVQTAAEHAVDAGIVPDVEPEAAAPEPRDQRVKLWQCTTRFWMMTANGPELMAETDPEIIEGTGLIPLRLESYGRMMHEEGSVSELSEAALKERLPQLRNNLGRQGSAVLRIEYETGGAAWLCQADVIRLDS